MYKCPNESKGSSTDSVQKSSVARNLSISEEDLWKVLAQNNIELHDALQDRIDGIEGADRQSQNEATEGILLVKLIKYCRGEISLEEVSK